MEGSKKPTNSQVANTFEQTSKLEKELLNVLRKKSPSDKNVTQLRLTIRENYEAIILSDIDFASHRDVDQLLWKCVYYRPIEEYRKIIKKYHQSAFGESATSAAPSTDQSNALAKEKLHKACAAFRTFLEEGGAYYEGLFNRIKQLYDQYRKENETRLAKMCLTSLHKCLIIQGDLARYTQLYNEQQTKDWTQAQRHYLHALELLPNNGNPHNQLAVLATYQDNSCEAIYRYFRSLAVKKPFVSARENLILLFEKNRQRYIAQQQQKQEEKNTGRSSSRRGRDGPKRGERSSQPVQLSPAETKQRFLTSFIRLHGILFTKTSMETFDNIQRESMEMLGQIHVPTDRDINTDEEHEDYLSESLVLKLVLMNVYSIQNTSTYSIQAQQHNPYLESACSLAFNTFQILAQHAVRTAPNYAYLGSLITFLQYVDQHREHTVYQFRDVAKATMWAGLASLLQTVGSNQSTYNHMIDDEIDVNSGSLKDRKLLEDIELSGFLPIKTESAPRSGSASKVIKGAAAIEVRVARLNEFVNRLINDDRTDIYFDYEKGTYTTDRVENIKPITTSPMRSPPQPKRVEPVEEVEVEDIQRKVPSPVKKLFSAPQQEEARSYEEENYDFMSRELMGSHAVMDDNQLLEDQFNDDDQFNLDDLSSGQQQPFANVIERPFGTSSSNQHVVNQNNGWGSVVNGSPAPATGNLMSKLLQSPQQQPQKQQDKYSSLFSTDNSLFGNDDTWAPMGDSKSMFASQSLFGLNNQNRSGAVIERPFQQRQAPQQPQALFNNGVLDSPFSNWRTSGQPQQMEFSPFGNFQASPQARLYQQSPQQQNPVAKTNN